MTEGSEIGGQPPTIEVALLTGGDDKPYVLGLAEAFTSGGIVVDLIGSDDLSVPELLNNRRINFLNLRGDQTPEASLRTKIGRIVAYYWRLIRYAATARPNLFHILWNNKFEFFDRSVLMLYYKLLGKKIAFTAHNVNARKRDGKDSFLNRLSLRIQYRLSDHIFVHTERMKAELLSDFSVQENKVSVIPFGINNTAPNTALTSVESTRNPPCVPVNTCTCSLDAPADAGAPAAADGAGGAAMATFAAAVASANRMADGVFEALFFIAGLLGRRWATNIDPACAV